MHGGPEKNRGIHLSHTYRQSRARFDDDEQTAVATRAPRWETREHTFKCVQCRRFVAPVPSGGRHRNHCPFCLFSRHVDADRPGDRLSDCGARMAPVGIYARLSGEAVLVHRCLGCGVERHNRMAADDDDDLVVALDAWE
jgi:hypothetical protein